MKILLQSAAVALALFSCAQAQEAELSRLDVKGLPGSPKGDNDGYFVVLLDSKMEALQVSAAVNVKDKMGSIESAQLFVQDKESKLLARALLLPWKANGHSSHTLEFDIRRELLEKSYVLIRSRKDDTITIAKLLLGTFHVSERESKPGK